MFTEATIGLKHFNDQMGRKKANVVIEQIAFNSMNLYSVAVEGNDTDSANTEALNSDDEIHSS